MQCLNRANFDVLIRIHSLLLAADRKPAVVMFHVPHVDLACDSVTADNLEEPEVFLVAVAPIEVDERLSGAEGEDLVFFVEGRAQDVGWALHR